jgi:ankyrin repeat protein
MTAFRQALAGFLVLTTASLGAAADPPLVEAARRGDQAAVERLLRQKDTALNAPGADGMTALGWAVQRDDLKVMALLLRAGADAKTPNRYGVTPLWLAAVNGSDNAIRQLLEAGVDPNVPFTDGETAVMTAARTGKADALQRLIDAGGKVNERTARGQTALMWAAAKDNAAAVQTLMRAGADLKIRTSSAARGGGEGLAIFNSPAPSGFTALLFAVRAGAIGAVRALLDAGTDVNDTLSDGQSALVVAAANGHWQLADLLLDRGANPNLAGAGWNALHQTVKGRRPNFGTAPGPQPTGTLDSLDLIKKLIAKGIDLNAQMTKNGMKDGQRNRLNRLGATAFLLAAKTADVEVMKVLAAAGADVRIASADGTTPLMVAAGLSMFGVGEDGGSLPGHEDEQFEAVKLCVELGSDINAANRMGETALHGAAFRGVNASVEYLVAKGARLDARDSRGWTPFTFANGLNYTDVFRQQPHTAALLQKLMHERGLSTEGQAADGTECVDCFQTHPDQARAAQDRDRKMEAEFAARSRRTP